MSNLSDVGFPTSSNEELNKLVESWLKKVTEIPCRKGSYLKFADESGAEIYLQMNFSGELAGFNPYFNPARQIVSISSGEKKPVSQNTSI